MRFARVNQALTDPEKYLSIVTDGMAQSHCQLPYQKNMVTHKSLPQHIQGVVAHGRRTSLFRTFHTVQNSANLQIHTFLKTLDDVMQKERRLPDTIYLQTDGGSENTAKTVFYIAELLVAKRLVKTVVLSRLMVGHTHCDIDAVFGRVWLRLRVSRALKDVALVI